MYKAVLVLASAHALQAPQLKRAPRAAAVAAVAPAPLTPAKLEAALQSTGLLVAGASAMFAKWAHGFQGHANALPLFDQARFARETLGVSPHTPPIYRPAPATSGTLEQGGRRSQHPILPLVLEARRGRGPPHPRAAAAVPLLELPAQQPLDGVAGLPPPHRPHQRRARARRRRR